MKAIVGIPLAIALLSLMGACESDDLGAKYSEVSEEDSGLLFFGPGLAGGYRQFLVGTGEDNTRRTTGYYGPYEGEFPNARMHFAEKAPGHYYSRLSDVADRIRAWGWFRERKIEKGPRGTAVNAIGRIDYIAVIADGVACVVWRQPMGPHTPRIAATMVLDGYYCKGEGPMMSGAEAESIVKLVGHRDYGLVWPPDDWWRIPGFLFAEIVDYGPYAADDGAEPPSGGAGPDRKAGGLAFTNRTERIPNSPGVAFGVEYVVKGGEDGDKVDVTIRVRHPDMAGQTETQWRSSARVGEPTFAGFRFGAAQHGAPGIWTVEVLQDDMVLGGKAFRVVEAD